MAEIITAFIFAVMFIAAIYLVTLVVKWVDARSDSRLENYYHDNPARGN